MIESFDVGSLPFVGDLKRLLEEAKAYFKSQIFFEKKIVDGLLDKARSDIDLPNYPQFRDMNEMFLELIAGVEKVKGGYIEGGVLSLQTETSV